MTCSISGADKHVAPIDVLLLFPVEPRNEIIVEPIVRQVIASFAGPILESFLELEARFQQPLCLTSDSARPMFGGYEIPTPKTCTLAAVALATHLERAGLSWHAADPGEQSMRWWRKYLARVRHLTPRAIGVSTTFISHYTWFGMFLAVVREIFPKATLVLGGASYVQSPKAYLSLDADVFCVGEGEERLPAMVRAIREGRPLNSIPGLYLAKPEGGLQYTGPVEPLNLSTLPAPDWTLVGRIDPPRDVERDVLEIAVETQRGCGFKCGFCTFRTLNFPMLTTPEEAVQRILATSVVKSSFVNIIDATATFPRSRWDAILDLLIDAGGSPRPLLCMARVTDLRDATVERMVKANVRHVFIGQESGDQRILNAMRKGINLKAVRPAMDALARHGLSGGISFIHGYPEETQESLENTRQMLLSLNDGYPGRPPIPFYIVFPFQASEVSTVVQEGKDDLQLEGEHVFAYRSNKGSSRKWMEECLKTFVAASRCPHAPASAITASRGSLNTFGLALTSSPHQFEIFRWMKLVERGVGMFLAARLGEGPPSSRLLDDLRRDLRAFYEPGAPRKIHAVSAGLRSALLRGMAAEYLREEQQGPGVLTRIALSGIAMTQRGSLRDAIETFRTGSVRYREGDHAMSGLISDNVAQMAKIAIDEGIEHGRRRPMMVDGEGQVVSLTRRPSDDVGTDSACERPRSTPGSLEPS